MPRGLSPRKQKVILSVVAVVVGYLFGPNAVEVFSNILNSFR